MFFLILQTTCRNRIKKLKLKEKLFMVYLKELTKFNKSVSTNVLNFLKDY